METVGTSNSTTFCKMGSSWSSASCQSPMAACRPGYDSSLDSVFGLFALTDPPSSVESGMSTPRRFDLVKSQERAHVVTVDFRHGLGMRSTCPAAILSKHNRIIAITQQTLAWNPQSQGLEEVFVIKFLDWNGRPRCNLRLTTGRIDIRLQGYHLSPNGEFLFLILETSIYRIPLIDERVYKPGETDLIANLHELGLLDTPICTFVRLGAKSIVTSDDGKRALIPWNQHWYVQWDEVDGLLPWYVGARGMDCLLSANGQYIFMVHVSTKSSLGSGFYCTRFGDGTVLSRLAVDDHSCRMQRHPVVRFLPHHDRVVSILEFENNNLASRRPWSRSSCVPGRAETLLSGTNVTLWPQNPRNFDKVVEPDRWIPPYFKSKQILQVVECGMDLILIERGNKRGRRRCALVVFSVDGNCPYLTLNLPAMVDAIRTHPMGGMVLIQYKDKRYPPALFKYVTLSKQQLHAFCQGLHPRLGKRSIVHSLPRDLLRRIGPFVSI